MTARSLYSKLESLTPELRSEANDFIDFLIEKAEKKSVKSQSAKFGSLKGKIKLSDNFDAPLEDFNEYM